jgi:uncharacterized membrane protein YqaE (UPF0057 family)
MTAPVADPIKMVFAIVLPPLGVFCAVGLRGQFWLNLVFTLLGYVPGIVHALYVILDPDQASNPGIRPDHSTLRPPCTGQYHRKGRPVTAGTLHR